MHILLVNDDGIGAIGIMALMKSAVRRGHRVTMCAPSGQMSATSQRITISEPIFAREYPVDFPEVQAYAISGTPADCVRVALCGGGLVTDPVDLVISGINKGENAGTAVFYSGTVAAAREASLLRVHAIAASIIYGAEPSHVQDLADFVVEIGEKYIKTPFERCSLLNINAPAIARKEWAGIEYAPLSKAHFTDCYERRFHRRAGTYFWLDNADNIEPPEEGSDLWYLNKNCAVLTIISNPICAPEKSFREMHLLG